MQSLLFILKQAPYDSIKAQEALEMILYAASFNFKISVLFADDAVLSLVNREPPLGRKNISGLIKSLELFEIDPIYVSASSLEKQSLTLSDLTLKANPITDNEIEKLKNQGVIEF